MDDETLLALLSTFGRGFISRSVREYGTTNQGSQHILKSHVLIDKLFLNIYNFCYDILWSWWLWKGVLVKTNEKEYERHSNHMQYSSDRVQAAKNTPQATVRSRLFHLLYYRQEKKKKYFQQRDQASPHFRGRLSLPHTDINISSYL